MLIDVMIIIIAGLRCPLISGIHLPPSLRLIADAHGQRGCRVRERTRRYTELPEAGCRRPLFFSAYVLYVANHPGAARIADATVLSVKIPKTAIWIGVSPTRRLRDRRHDRTRHRMREGARCRGGQAPSRRQ